MCVILDPGQTEWSVENDQLGSGTNSFVLDSSLIHKLSVVSSVNPCCRISLRVNTD